MSKLDEFVNLQFSSPTTGAASGLMNLSRQFEGYRKQAFESRKRKVVEEQTAEGQAAFQKGEKPEFKEEGFIGGVSSRAYNAGLRHSYLSSLNNDVKENIAKFKLENATDSAAFQSAIAGERAALQKEIDPSVLPDVLESFDREAVIGLNQVRGQEHKQFRKEQFDSDNKNIESLQNSAMIAARQLDVAQSQKDLSDIDAFLQSSVEAELRTPAEAEEIKRDVTRLAASQGWIGWVEGEINDHGLEDAVKSVQELPTKPQEGFTQPEWDALRLDMQQTVNRKKAIKLGDEAERKNRGKALLDNFEKMHEHGIPVPPNDERKVFNSISGNEALEERFSLIKTASSFAVMPVSDRKAEIERIKAGTDVENIDYLDTLLRADASVTAAAKKDAVSLGERQMIVPKVEWDFSSTESIAAGVDQAEINRDRLKEQYGVNPNLVKDAELIQFQEFFKSEAVNPVSRADLVVKVGPESVLWEQLDAKGEGSLGAVAATGDVGLTSQYFVGQDRIAAGEVKFPKGSETSDGWQPIADEYFDTAFLSVPSAKVNATNAALSIMAANSVTFDPQKFEEALLKVTGQAYERPDGSKYMTPPSVKAGRWDYFIDNFEADLVPDFGEVVGFTNEQVAELVRGGNLIQKGSNEYQVLGINRAGSPAVLMKPDGEPYELFIDDTYVTGAESRVDLMRRRQAAERAERFTRGKDAQKKLRGDTNERTMDRASDAARRFREVN